MSVEIWRRILVDRISIKVNLVSKELYKETLSQLFKMHAQRKEILPEGNIVMSYSKYCKRLCYYPEYTSKQNKRGIAYIELGSYFLGKTNKLQRYFRLTLHPSKFRGNEFQNLKQLLAKMLPVFSYDKLHATGMVNYLELACDTLSHAKNSFLPYRKYCYKSNVYVEPSGHQGTTYVGSKSSDLWYAIYDKRKQLQDTGKPLHFGKSLHTRIEARMRQLGVSASELQGIQNPFLKLRVADLTTAQGINPDKDWQSFISHSLAVGVPEALRLRPKKQKKYRAVLDSLQVKWWNPAVRWADLPKALAVLAP